MQGLVMKQVLWAILLFSLFLPVVVAADTIFDSTTVSGEEFEAGGMTFKMTFVEEGGNKTFALLPLGSNLILEGEECESNNFFEVCISDIEFDHRDHDLFIDVYKMDVKIVKLSGGLEVETFFDQTKFEVGEQAGARLMLRNIGNFELIDINVSLPLHNFSVTQLTGCLMKDGFLVWEGELLPSKEKFCSFEMTALRPISFTAQATAQFNNTNSIETATANETVLTINPYSLEINRTFIVKNATIGKEAILELSIGNTHPSLSLHLTSFTLIYPYGFLTLKEVPKGFTKGPGILRWSRVFQTKDSSSFTFEFDVKQEGNHEIGEFYRYNQEGRTVDFSHVNDIVIEKEIAEITFGTDQESILENGSTTLALSIANPTTQDFTNIQASVDSPLVTASTNYHRITAGDNVTVLSKDIEVEDDTVEGIYLVPLTVTYTVGGQKKTSTQSILFTVGNTSLEDEDVKIITNEGEKDVDEVIPKNESKEEKKEVEDTTSPFADEPVDPFADKKASSYDFTTTFQQKLFGLPKMGLTLGFFILILIFVLFLLKRFGTHGTTSNDVGEDLDQALREAEKKLLKDK